MDAPLNHTSHIYNLLISQEKIAHEVEDFADCLNEEYGESPIVLLAVLKGSICFLADLMRQLDMDVEVGFIRASSHGMRGTERGALTIESVGSLELEGKDVILLDDIFDSGTTLEALAKILQEK